MNASPPFLLFFFFVTTHLLTRDLTPLHPSYDFLIFGYPCFHLPSLSDLRAPCFSWDSHGVSGEP